MSASRARLVLGVALDDAIREPASLVPDRLIELARIAERGVIDFVSLDDGFDPQHPVAGAVPFRFDAVLALARVAAATEMIGVIPTATTTHTEPFHNSKNVGSLDLV